MHLPRESCYTLIRAVCCSLLLALLFGCNKARPDAANPAQAGATAPDGKPAAAAGDSAEPAAAEGAAPADSSASGDVEFPDLRDAAVSNDDEYTSNKGRSADSGRQADIAAANGKLQLPTIDYYRRSKDADGLPLPKQVDFFQFDGVYPQGWPDWLRLPKDTYLKDSGAIYAGGGDESNSAFKRQFTATAVVRRTPAEASAYFMQRGIASGLHIAMQNPVETGGTTDFVYTGKEGAIGFLLIRVDGKAVRGWTPVKIAVTLR